MGLAREDLRAVASGTHGVQHRRKGLSESPVETFRGMMIALSLGLVFWGAAVLIWFLL